MTFAMVVIQEPKSHNSTRRAKYHAHLAGQARARFPGQPLVGDLYIRIVWVHQGKPRGGLADADNISKPIVDALRGVIYEDDNTIAKRIVQRVDATKGACVLENRGVPREILDEFGRLIVEDHPHLIYIEVGPLISQKIVLGPIDGS